MRRVFWPAIGVPVRVGQVSDMIRQTSRSVLLNGVAMAAMMLPATAFAQAASGETQLKTIVVEGQAAAGAKPTTKDAVGPVRGIVPKATVSGSKTAT